MTENLSYDQIYKELFVQLGDFWTRKTPTDSTSEDSLDKLSLDEQSTLCFFSVPNELVAVYREYIFPIFRKNGLAPVVTSEILSHGRNVTATMKALIDKAIMVIIDIGSTKSRSRFEIDLALHKNLDTIIIKEQEGVVYYAGERIRIFVRPPFTKYNDIDQFLKELEKYVMSFSNKLMSELLLEPKRLLNEGKYRYAVISSFILLETELRKKFHSDESLRNLVHLARETEDISISSFNSILSWMDIRNKAVHTSQDITSTQADIIVSGISRILIEFTSNYDKRPKILNERDRTILGTEYFKALCEKSSDIKENVLDMRQVYDFTGMRGFDKDTVLPLIIHKLKSMGYIKKIGKFKIALTPLGREHCGEDIILDKGL